MAADQPKSFSPTSAESPESRSGSPPPESVLPAPRAETDTQESHSAPLPPTEAPGSYTAPRARTETLESSLSKSWFIVEYPVETTPPSVDVPFHSVATTPHIEQTTPIQESDYLQSDFPIAISSPWDTSCSQIVCGTKQHMFVSPRNVLETGEFVIDTENRHQVYAWPEANFQLLLFSPVPQQLHDEIIHVETVTAGRYHFPPDTTPVSAIFKISAPKVTIKQLEFEHCYAGDVSDLAFVRCGDSSNVFNFVAYESNFTLTHGVVTICSSACSWCIVCGGPICGKRPRTSSDNSASPDENSVKKLKSDQLPVLPNCKKQYVSVNCYYRNLKEAQDSSYIKVDIVISKKVDGYLKDVKADYSAWTPHSNAATARLSEDGNVIAVELPEANKIWSNVEDSIWQVQAVHPPPEVLMEPIEMNTEKYVVIPLRYKCSSRSQDLEHTIKFKGLDIVTRSGTPFIINLMIPRNSNFIGSPRSNYPQPSIQLLKAFKGKNQQTIDIVERIAPHYKDFAMHLINDSNHEYVKILEQDYHGKSIRITEEILGKWIDGRVGAESVSWDHLVAALNSTGLGELAREIKEVTDC